LGDGGFLNFDAAGFDAGFQPFMRTPAPGVVCGTGPVCDADAGSLCCISLLSGTPACGTTCALGLGLFCDGQEDCNTGNVCCFTGLQTGATCVSPSECVTPDGGGGLIPKLQLCNVSSECPAGAGCCESATLKGYAPTVSQGVCTPGCGL
jgi:hypothetical protein